MAQSWARSVSDFCTIWWPWHRSSDCYSTPSISQPRPRLERGRAAAHRIGCEILLLKASSDSEIDAAFAAIRTRIGALLVGTDPFFNSRRQHIVLLAAREAVPVMFDQRAFAASGGLISYGTSLADAYRQVGIYAAADEIRAGDQSQD